MISVRDLANPYILDLVPYEPGKPIEDVAREMGLEPGQIIKLASNENPLGPSPKALEASREALGRCHLYPDGGGYHLRNGIAEHLGLQRENIVLGNGSNEVILLLFQAFCRPGVHDIVVAQNSFAVYELAAQLFGVRCVKVPDGDGYQPDLAAIRKAITPQTRLVFLASPNNPTGTRIPNDALDAFLEDLPEHVICGLDEAYYEFLDDPPDTLRHVREGRKVCLTRTFSKAQGLAGLRIGYGIGSAELVDLLQRSRQPFNANLVAQAAALAGLRDTEHQRRTKEVTDAGRRQLEKAFREQGLPFIPSAANFILVRVGDGDAVFRRMMKRGVIIRSMKSYRLPEWVRVSIGLEGENARFLRELPYALKGEEPPFPVPASAAPAKEPERPVRRAVAPAPQAAAPVSATNGQTEDAATEPVLPLFAAPAQTDSPMQSRPQPAATPPPSAAAAAEPSAPVRVEVEDPASGRYRPVADAAAPANPSEDGGPRPWNLFRAIRSFFGGR